jgi:hypothetical protein
MEFINATGLHRKSGGAKWRDLQSSRKVENPPPPGFVHFD